MAFEPIKDIRFPAQGTYIDDLFESEQVSRNTRVDGIGELDIILLIGLNDGGGVNSGGGAKSIFTKHRIICRNRNAGCARHSLAVVLQFAEILPVPGSDAHQLQIHEHLVHLRVTDPLPGSKRAGVNTVGAGGKRSHGISDGKTAIAMAVPVDPNLFAAWFDYLVKHEFRQGMGAQWRRMPGGVSHHNRLCAAVNGG